MALKIELKGTTPGRAELRISGGGTDPGPIEIAIQRNQDEYYLAEGGIWQATPFWHLINSVEQQNDGVVAGIGPGLVDPLVASTGMMFVVSVRSAGINGQQVMKPSGRLLGSGAAGTDDGGQTEVTPPPPPPPSPPPPAPAPPPPAPPPPAPPPPAPSPPPPTASGKRWLWIVLVMLLVGIGAAAVWYLGLFGGGAGTATGEDATVPTAPTQPPSLTGRARAQAFLRTNPAPAEMLAAVNEWESAGDCEAALIVFNTAAGSDAAASMALAQRYDPASVRADGCITTADAETAIYWYEQPADQGERDAQSRLGLLLTERNSSGPLYDRGLTYLRQAAEAGDESAAERLRKLGGG